MDNIYTITAGHIKTNNWRCWAWFESLDEAQRAVNGCNEFFCGEDCKKCYDVLVIEEVPRGAITPEYHEWWYEWHEDRWRTIIKPIEIETIFHFGVG